MKLDKSKSYGIISGTHSAVYEQDGKLFAEDGSEVVAEQINILPPEQIAAQKASDEAVAAEALAKKEAAEAAAAAKSAADAKAKAETAAAVLKNKGGRPPKAQSAIDAQIAAQGGQ